MTDDSPDEILAIGREATRLLENHVLKRAADDARERLTRQWVETAPEDTDRREALWHQIRTVDAIMASLQHLADRAYHLERKGRA